MVLTNVILRAQPEESLRSFAALRMTFFYQDDTLLLRMEKHPVDVFRVRFRVVCTRVPRA